MPLDILPVVNTRGQVAVGDAAPAAGLNALFAALLMQSVGTSAPGVDLTDAKTPDAKTSAVKIPEAKTPAVKADGVLPIGVKASPVTFPKCGTPGAPIPKCGTPSPLIPVSGTPLLPTSEVCDPRDFSSDAPRQDDETDETAAVTQAAAPLTQDAAPVPLWLIPASPPPLLFASVPAAAPNALPAGEAMDAALTAAPAPRAPSIPANGELLSSFPITPNSPDLTPPPAGTPKSVPASVAAPPSFDAPSFSDVASSISDVSPSSFVTSPSSFDAPPSFDALTPSFNASASFDAPLSAGAHLPAPFASRVSSPAVSPPVVSPASVLPASVSPTPFLTLPVDAPLALKSTGKDAGKNSGEIDLQKPERRADNRPESAILDPQKFGENATFLPVTAKSEIGEKSEPSKQENGAETTSPTPSFAPQISTMEMPKNEPVKIAPLLPEERARLMTQAADGVRQVHLQTTPDGHGQMTLTLHPHQWGQVQLSVTTTAGDDGKTAIRAQIIAENPTVKATLEAHAPELHRALREAGLSVENLSVTTKSPDVLDAKPAVSALGGGENLTGNFSGQDSAGGANPFWSAPNAERNADASNTGDFSSFNAFAGQQPQTGQQPNERQNQSGSRVVSPQDWETLDALPTLPAAFSAGRLDARA